MTAAAMPACYSYKFRADLLSFYHIILLVTSRIWLLLASPS
jgi:hypothetical protein